MKCLIILILAFGLLGSSKDQVISQDDSFCMRYQTVLNGKKPISTVMLVKDGKEVSTGHYASYTMNTEIRKGGEEIEKAVKFSARHTYYYKVNDHRFSESHYLNTFEDVVEPVQIVSSSHRDTILGDRSCMIKIANFRGKKYKIYIDKSVLLPIGVWKLWTAEGMIIQAESLDEKVLFKYQSISPLLNNSFHAPNKDRKSNITYYDFRDTIAKIKLDTSMSKHYPMGLLELENK
jgi:hypothetical protein